MEKVTPPYARTWQLIPFSTNTILSKTYVNIAKTKQLSKFNIGVNNTLLQTTWRKQYWIWRKTLWRIQYHTIKSTTILSWGGEHKQQHYGKVCFCMGKAYIAWCYLGIGYAKIWRWGLQYSNQSEQIGYPTICKDQTSTRTTTTSYNDFLLPTMAQYHTMLPDITQWNLGKHTAIQLNMELFRINPFVYEWIS